MAKRQKNAGKRGLKIIIKDSGIFKIGIKQKGIILMLTID